MNMHYANVHLDAIDQTVRVGYEYEPGDPGIHTFSNGDPGYPPTPDGVLVEEVWLKAVDIAPVLDPALFEYLEENVYEAHAKQAKDNYEEHQADLAQQRIDEGDHL